MGVIGPAQAAAAFERACLEELEALKPGNVHVHRGGHGMEAAQFKRAAAAAAPEIAQDGASVGQRIEAAVAASWAAAGCNTNLGIVLLAAPLVTAAMQGGGETLRARLEAIVAALTVADAVSAYRAIRLANPGGLGEAAEHDVAAAPRVTLFEAMRAAAERDRIARQYASGFADVFDIGVVRLETSRRLDRLAAVEAVHLDFMAAFPDTHIARKFGPETAEAVRLEAAAVRAGIDWRGPQADRRRRLAAFDDHLKTRGLNPGTSADLTVASLLAEGLEAGSAKT